jgi:hypothetical protein
MIPWRSCPLGVVSVQWAGHPLDLRYNFRVPRRDPLPLRTAPSNAAPGLRPNRRYHGYFRYFSIPSSSTNTHSLIRTLRASSTTRRGPDAPTALTRVHTYQRSTMGSLRTLVRTFSVVYLYSDPDFWFTIVPVPASPGCVNNESSDKPSDDSWDGDFTSLIPLDCPTSTPVSISRRVMSKTPSPDRTFICFGESPRPSRIATPCSKRGLPIPLGSNKF